MINKYIVHLNNGGTFEIYASNMSGAKMQTKSFAKFVERLERVYKTGNRAAYPW